MTTTKTPDTEGQYGVVSLGYNEYIFPLDVAVLMLKHFAVAEMVEGYGDSRKILPPNTKITLTLLSEAGLREMRTRQLLLGDSN